MAHGDKKQPASVGEKSSSKWRHQLLFDSLLSSPDPCQPGICNAFCWRFVGFDVGKGLYYFCSLWTVYTNVSGKVAAVDTRVYYTKVSGLVHVNRCWFSLLF